MSSCRVAEASPIAALQRKYVMVLAAHRQGRDGTSVAVIDSDQAVQRLNRP
jgi:hypothetical protein